MGISEKPVIALIALDDNVRLGILPHSNKFLKEGFTDKLTAAIDTGNCWYPLKGTN